jgi:hypothetical protein
MTELKTKPTKKSVDDFLKKVEHPTKREDSFKILNLMKEVTKEEPIMWGDSIVGFGDYHYKYASGRDAHWFLVGFSPRKQNLTVYFMSGFEKNTEILKDLGKFKTGKSCLYINKLKDINLEKLKELVSDSIKQLKSDE